MSRRFNAGFFAGKRVFLTGHTGFKGAWLALWLKQMGAQVCGYSDMVPTTPALFDLVGLGKDLEDHRADIRDAAAVKASMQAFKPEIVLHLAAQPLVIDSYKLPRETFDVNVMGTVNVLEAIRSTPSVRSAVIITTDKCYENDGRLEPYSEDDRLGGSDPYSASKACAEIVSHSYFRSFFGTKEFEHLGIATARAGNVIGGGDWSANRIVPDCARAWLEKQPVAIRNPEFTRPWQHVLEPLHGYLRLAQALYENPKEFGLQSFNFGPRNAEPRKVRELVEALAKYLPGLEMQYGAPSQWKEAKDLSLESTKAYERLGWTDLLAFEGMAEWTGEWYRAFRDTPQSLRSLTEQQIRDFQNRLA